MASRQGKPSEPNVDPWAQYLRQKGTWVSPGNFDNSFAESQGATGQSAQAYPGKGIPAFWQPAPTGPQPFAAEPCSPGMTMSYATSFGPGIPPGIQQPNSSVPRIGQDASCRTPTLSTSISPNGFSTFKPLPEQRQTPAPPSQGADFNAATFASALGSGSSASRDHEVHSAFQMLGRRGPGQSFQSRSLVQSPPDLLIAQALNQALVGERKNIPVWNGSPSTLRSWLKLLALWEYESQVPADKRGIKLLQSFPEGSQPRRIADTVPTEVLLSSKGYSAILTALHEKYAPYLEASGPQAIDRFLFEGERQKNESFSSYIASKELAKQEMEAQLGEMVSDRLCGRILLKQAGLSEFQRELIMLRGPVLRGFDETAALLRPLDRPEALVKGNEGGHSKHFFAEGQASEGEEEDSSEGSEALEDEAGNLLFDMEDREYDESEALAVYAYHNAYRDVRRELQQRRNDRGYTRRDKSREDGPRRSSQSRPRMDRSRGRPGSMHLHRSKGRGKGKRGTESDLLLRTRCFGCHELGHLAKDCPLKKNPASGGGPASSPSKKGLIVVGGGGGQSHAYMMRVPRTIQVYAGISCRASEALVDTAAEDAVIGENAMQRLRQSLRELGLQVLPVEAGAAMPGAGGIGGPAQVLGLFEVPIGVAQVNGVLRFTVLKDSESEIPPLLPIKYLESVGAILDFAHDMYTTRFGPETTMRRLPTGHRAVNILDFDKEGWNLPVHLRKDPAVDPFILLEGAQFMQQTKQQVLVWLARNDQLEYVQTLVGPKSSLVLPEECHLDPDTLQPTRTTHLTEADENGHSFVLHDRWDVPWSHQNRPPWHGSVVFHALDGLEFVPGGSDGLEHVSSSSRRSMNLAPRATTTLSCSSPSSSASRVTTTTTPIPTTRGHSQVVTFNIADSEETKTIGASSSNDSPDLQGPKSASSSNTPKSERTSVQHDCASVTGRLGCGRRSRKNTSELPLSVPSMLKQLLGFLSVFGAQHSHVLEGTSLSTPEGSRGRRGCQTQASVRQGVGLEALDPGHFHDLGEHSPRDAHGVYREQEETVRREGAGAPLNQPELQRQEEFLRDSAEDGHRQTAEPFDGSKELEQSNGGLCPSSRTSSPSSRPGTVLVHLPPMREQVGAPGRELRKLQQHDVCQFAQESRGGLSESDSGAPWTTSSTRSPGDGEDEGRIWSSKVQAGAKGGIAVENQSFGGHSANGAKQDSNVCKVGVDEQPRVLGDPFRRGSGCIHGAAPSFQNLEILSGEQLKKRGFCMPRSTTKGLAQWAVFLLCSFVNAAPFTGIPPVTIPWLGEPTHFLLMSQPEFEFNQCESLNWQSCQDCSKYAGTEHFASCWAFCPNESNKWWGQEDSDVIHKEASLTKVVKQQLSHNIKTYVCKSESVVEVFSPPRMSKEARNYGVESGGAFDLTEGYDFRRAADRQFVVDIIRVKKPALVILSPSCTESSVSCSLSNFPRDPDKVRAEEEETQQLTEFAVQVAMLQLEAGRGFLFAHAPAATSWELPALQRLLSRPEVQTVAVDMSVFQFQPAEREAESKRAQLSTNLHFLAKALRRRCSRPHEHRPILGGQLCGEAAMQPRAFGRAVLAGLRRRLQNRGVFFYGKVAADEHGPPQGARSLAMHLGQALAPGVFDYVVDEISFQGEWAKVFAVQSENFGSGGGEIELSSRRPEMEYADALPMCSANRSSTALSTWMRSEPGSSKTMSTSASFPSSRMLSPEARPAIEEPGFRDPVLRRAQRELRPLGEGPEAQQRASEIRGDHNPQLAPDLRRELYRLHRNLGHPDHQAFIRALKHAGAREEVISWAKTSFRCPLCEGQRKPSAPRPGHLARALEFNMVVGVDTFFLNHLGKTHNFLNCVCWGSGLQVVEEISEVTATTTFETFGRCWLKPYGCPIILVVDQGPEYFGKAFQHHLSAMGIMIHFTDARSPWQAAKTERMGGVFKSKLRVVLEEVQATTDIEFNQCVTETQVARNRYYHRSGFTPYQRVFDYNPRLPASLAADDIMSPILVHQSASEPIKQAWKIREAAAAAWLRRIDEETVKRGLATTTRTSDIKNLNVGEWVYVWRNTPNFKGWSGPGVLLAESPNERSLWVSLRGHLVKVSREQVRRATSEENLGAELIKELSSEMLRDINAGKVQRFQDLQGEGEPDHQGEGVEIQLSPIVEEDEPEANQSSEVAADIPEDVQGYSPTDVEPMDVEDEGALREILGADEDERMEQPPLPPLLQGEEDELLQAQSASTRTPATPERTPTPTATPMESRRHSLRVDEGSSGSIAWGPIREAPTTSSTTSSAMPYPFANAPRSWPAPSRPSHYMEVASFEESRTQHTFWVQGDGAMWYQDKQRGRSSLAALGTETFTATEAEASYSAQDRCVYLTKAKTSPGQVQFNKLSEKHKEVFRASRRKEVKSLLENQAIKILSVEESRKFRQSFPKFVLRSRYVDRWKPDGDKFSVLPQEFDNPNFDPQHHGGLSAKSRWCIIGWEDPMIHEVERAAPTPLTASLYSAFQISASRKWPGYLKDVKTRASPLQGVNL